jgi:hypothetical protein
MSNNNAEILKSYHLSLSRDRQAKLVIPKLNQPINLIVQSLALPVPKGIILIFGSANGLQQEFYSLLTPIFIKAIAKFGVEKECVILDGGTNYGVMRLIGEGVAAQRSAITLIGVVPVGKFEHHELLDSKMPIPDSILEPNHTHFVLAPSNKWGGETDLLFALAKNLGKNKPILAIVAGGGVTVLKEVLYCVRDELPILVITGCGGVADEIAAYKDTPIELIEDPKFSEILQTGNLQYYPYTTQSEILYQSLLEKWVRFGEHNNT